MALQPIGLDATITNVPDFTGGIDKMNRSVDSFAKDTAEALGKAAGLTQDAAGRWRAATGRFASDAELAAAGIEKLTPAAKAAGDAAEKAGEDAKKGGRGFDVFGEIVTGALRKIGEIAVNALQDAARAVAGFVKDSIGLAGDFEAGMNEFRVAAGKDIDTKGIEQFHDLFLALGKELPVSTADVQQAAIEMVKGGLDPAILAAGGLKQNIQFAAAAMSGDLVKAAEISSKIVGGWASVGATAAEKADLLTHATDQLTRAANASQVDVEGLSLGIFNAQGIARTAGVSFDDLTTTLAVLAPRFASSSEAGNSLKNVIARLQPTTIPAQDAMKRLGLLGDEIGNVFYDSTGKFVGFQQASQLLQESLVGLNEKQRQSALQTIFGNDAMSSAAALAELGAAGYQEMADSMAKAMGVVEAGATVQEGFNNAADNARGSVEALQISLGEKLLPVLTDLTNNVVAPFVNILADMASGGAVTEKTFAALSPTMQGVATAIQDFVKDVEQGIKIAVAIGAEIQAMIASFQKASQSSDGFGGAIEKLNGVFQLALSVITNVANGYLAIANAVLPIIQRLWTEHGEEIGDFVKKTYDSIIQIITLALQVYNAIVPPVLNAIAGFFSDNASEITKILSGLGEMIGAIVTGFMETVKGVFKLALDLIHGDWQAAWVDVQAIVVAQATAIGGVISGFLNVIAGLFDTSLGEILQTWEDNWNMAVNIVQNIDWAAAGASVVQGIIQGISDWAGELFAELKRLASDAWDAFMEGIKGASPSKLFAEAGQSITTGIMMGLTDSWPTLTALIGTLSEDLIDEMEDIGSRMQDAIADGFGATASIDRQIAKNLDKFKDILPQYQQYTTGALKEAQLQAQEFLDPAEGAKFFKMRSDQILEYAKLQKDLDDQQQSAVDAVAQQAAEMAKSDELRAQIAVAATDEERAALQKKLDTSLAIQDADIIARRSAEEAIERINQQMLLVNAAQAAEIKQFDATKSATSPMAAIADHINEIMKALADPKLKLTDEQLHIVDMLSTIWGALQAPPAASPRTPYNPGTTTNTTNLNMPIYTNNTPAAMQQSMAIAGAALL